MVEYRKGSHSVSHLTVHLVWVTKYRYHVLKGDVQVRTRALIVQICDSENVQILKGVVGKDHVHLHVVPRWSGDTNFMSSLGETRVLPPSR